MNTLVKKQGVKPAARRSAAGFALTRIHARY
jgi:hypothetical protein